MVSMRIQAMSLTVRFSSATFFFQNGVAGACGKVHGDDELIAAIGMLLNNNALSLLIIMM